MALFAITTVLPSGDRSNVWFPFDHPAESIEEFWNALAEDGCVHGVKIDLKRNRDGETFIKECREAVIGLAGIVTVQSYQLPHALRAEYEAA